MKIKVAYLDYSKQFAGAERALYTIISHLDRERFEPIIVFPFPYEHHHRYHDLDCEKLYLSDDVKWWMGTDRWKKPVRGTDFIKRTIFGYKLAKTLHARGVQLLHVNLLRPDCFMWMFFCKRVGVKIIGHYRSLDSSWRISSKVQRCCDAIICVSDIVRNVLKEEYIHPNINTIYDSVLLPSNHLTIKSKNIISSIGVLAPHKGHDNAIKAFAKVAEKYPDYELHIVGGGRSKERELIRLKEIAAAVGCSERIKFTEDQVLDIERYYGQSKLILSLTKQGEAFGLVPFEAALCGTPTIAPNKGAIMELLEDGVSGIMVETQDVEAIAARIDWVLEHYNDALDICSKTLAVIENRLTPQIMDTQIMEVYKNLCR